MEELVEIAWVGNQWEAEIIQAQLEERGIPSLQQQVGVDGAQLGQALPAGGGSRG